jgi:hypothetical protein
MPPRFLKLSLLITASLAVSLPLLTHAQSPSTPPSTPSTQPSTQPAQGSDLRTGALELRAAQALNSGDYAQALPLLRRLSDLYQSDPRKLAAINEQIRVCEKQLNAGNAGGTLPPEQRKPIPPPQPGQTVVFDSIKDLGNFEYDPEKGGGIPADVKALSGHPIKVRGFMIPMDQAASITHFALVPSLFSCCFGQPPGIQHTIVVSCPKGKAVSYYPDELTIEGTLTVNEKKEDGFVVSLFELTATSVKPAQQ